MFCPVRSTQLIKSTLIDLSLRWYLLLISNDCEKMLTGMGMGLVSEATAVELGIQTQEDGEARVGIKYGNPGSTDVFRFDNHLRLCSPPGRGRRPTDSFNTSPPGDIVNSQIQIVKLLNFQHFATRWYWNCNTRNCQQLLIVNWISLLGKWMWSASIRP